MYFGRSIFQSVVERLQSESSEAQQEPAENSPRKPSSLSAPFIVQPNTATDDGVSTQDVEVNFGAQFFDDYALDDDFVSQMRSQQQAPETSQVAEKAPPVIEQLTAEAVAQPEKDYSYLNQCSTEDVKAELSLETIRSVNKLQAKRRQFARDNHPDRVPPQWREQATARMTAANLLIDQAVKEIALRARLGA